MSLALTTMLSKLTWQFGLLKHELVLPYIFEKNKTSFCKKLGFSSQGHTILPDDHHDLVTESYPSYGVPSMTTGKLSGAGRSSSCIHAAQKTPWSLPPLTFPEHPQGTCSCILPLWALSARPPATSSAIRDHNRLWWIEGDVEKT